MNRIGRLLVFFVGSALAAFAMPTLAAPVKTFSISATSPIPAGGGAVTLVIANVTPSGGNSAINSILINKPAGWTIGPAFSSNGTSTMALDASGNLRVNAFSGLLPKNQQGIHAISITFNLTPSTPVGCSAGAINWASLAGVFTGNALSGDMFTWDGVGGSSVVSATACQSVTYNGNGNTSGAAPTDSNLYPSGATVTVRANTGSLARTGYTFIGWNTAANGSGTDYAASGSATLTMGSANVVLYAKWQVVTNSVTYVGNGSTGGTVPIDGTSYASGATVTVKANTGGLTRTGYRFSNWNTAADGSGTSYAATGSATFTMGPTAVTLYAQWTPVYTVTYAGNGNTGGTAPTDANSYANGETVTVKANTGGLTKTGYTLTAWNTAANGSGTNYATTGSATFTMGSASVTLYAKWTQNTLAIHVPPNATLGEPFTVTVDLMPPGNDAVTLSSSDCTLTFSQTNATPSLVTFSATITGINNPTSHSCTITASAGSNYVSAMAIISPVHTGVLGCGDPPGNNKGGNLAINTDPPLAYIGPPDWGLVRALSNKDQNPCTVAVPYQFEFDPSTNTAAFIIPDTLGQKVAVEYVLLWSPIVTDTVPSSYPGLPFALANLAWIKDTGGAWVYVPALACVEDDVEAGLVIPPAVQPVMPIIPNVEPFVTLGGTYPGYAPGQVALMCVAQEGWTSIGRNGSGQKTRQYWHKVIDYADGGARLSN